MHKAALSKMERMEAAIKLKPLDRIPCAPLMDVYFPAKYKGYSGARAIRDWKIGFSSIVEVFEEVGGWDGMILPGYSMAPTPNVYAGIGVGKNLIPGSDLPDDSIIQFEEKEVITRDDYDDIIKMGWNGFRVKHKNRFNPAPDETILKWTKGQMEKYRHELQTWHDKGVRSLCGTITESPLMFLSTSRTLMEISKDIRQIPEKLEAVMEAMLDDLIKEAIDSANISGEPGVMLVMERGAGFYYPLPIYERFEYPHMKRMVEAFSAAGLITVMHLDQDYTKNVPYFKDLPAKMVVAEFDSRTDIFKAKEILKGHMCIAGDVPAALLSLGTPKEVEAYCKKLIDVVGDGGGFILSTGCTCPVECRMENFQAMIDTAKNYFPH
ncbi:MAG: uroporphyrinogen decarboxylase family protein [Syntrophobacteraceae bacterium]|jgi:uroporphyrinogen-III decarboxylase